MMRTRFEKMVTAAPGGKYFNVATGTIDLGTVYDNLIASAEKKKHESETIKRYEEKISNILRCCIYSPLYRTSDH